MRLSKKIEESNYKYIFACDETAVWLDASAGKCIEDRGAKEVGVLTTGHEKLRITVMLTARADGKKMLPFVIMPRKIPDPKVVAKFRNRLNLCWKNSKWFDNDITKEYLEKSFGGLNFFKQKQRSLLIWDRFASHMSDSTIKCMEKLDMDSFLVPGGTTKFVQCADVSWNAPFKAHIRQQYEDWILTTTPELTKSGNPKAASMDLYLTWICNAWDQITEETIHRSFKTCGVTLAQNGEEDHLIHCFQPDGSIPSGLQALRNARVEKDIEDLVEPLESVGFEKFREEAESIEEIDSDASIDFDM